jgi:integrase/recombinase XerD
MLKGIRDRAILATLLASAERSCACCGSGTCRAVRASCICGSRASGARFVPLPFTRCRCGSLGSICKRGSTAGRQEHKSLDEALFRLVRNNRTGVIDKHLDDGCIYRNIIRKYGSETGINAEVNGLCVHSLRATATTKALSHEADIAKVQEWLGHANIYDTPLLPAQDTARRQSHVSCEVLTSR